MKKVSSAIGIGLFCLVMFVALTGVGKGFVYSLFWGGQSTLYCGGSFKMHIKDKKIDMASGPVFSVGGDCEITIENCDIKAPVVLSGGGSAHVVLKGGRIEGTQKAISVGGHIVVTVEGTEVIGPVSSGGNARIEGLNQKSQ